MQEVNIHKILYHPNITKYYEYFEHEEDSFCLILEYVEGYFIYFILFLI